MRLMRIFTQERGGTVAVFAEYKSAEGKRVKRKVGEARQRLDVRQMVRLVAVKDKEMKE